MTEDALGDDVVEGLSKDLSRIGIVVRKSGPLYSDDILAELTLDRCLDKPVIRLDAEITPRVELRDQKPAGPQATATKVEKLVMPAQSDGKQKRELRCPHEVVPIRRADPCGIMVRAWP